MVETKRPSVGTLVLSTCLWLTAILQGYIAVRAYRRADGEAVWEFATTGVVLVLAIWVTVRARMTSQT